MLCTTTFERLLSECFLTLGAYIGRRPLLVIVLSLLTTAIASIGLIWFVEVNNVRSQYSPLNSPSRTEYAVAKEFLQQNGPLDPAYVMVEANDHGNLLRREYRDKLVELVRELQHNVTVRWHDRDWRYTDLCEPYCELCTAFLAFLTVYDEKEPSTHSYPAIHLFGTKAFIGNNVYNVTLKPNTDQMDSFTTAILPFYLVTSNQDEAVLFEWQKMAKRHFANYSHTFQVEMTSDALVSYEVRRMGMETAPLIAGSVVAMIIFVVFSSFRRDPSRSKFWESLIGCLIPLLALLTSSGILAVAGLEFQSIMVASLFLVLSVGVDDVFIILRAWDRTESSETVPRRLAVTLEDAGPSITISSLTNAAAFVIGISSSTPAVRAFSLYSAVAVMVCYFYQLILFSAVLALSGYRERAGRQSIFCCLKANPQARSAVVEKVVRLQQWVIVRWSNIISRWPARLVLCAVMLLYYWMSVAGIAQLHTYISIEKMALPDSWIAGFQHRYETALRNMQPISVFVTQPGDLRDSAKMTRVRSLVSAFENAKHSYGPNSTSLWLEHYLAYLQFYVDSDQFTYTEIPAFFNSSSYFFLASFVKFHEEACLEDRPECISAFFFMTNFHDVIKYHELIPVVADWRRITDEYADLGVYAYSDHAPFVDQTTQIDQTVWSSVLAALLCTAVACFFFIPHLPSIVVAVASVFSITLGIMGILSWWSVDLDPLSLAALLMSIGFSVDFTAHLCFHFYKSAQLLVRHRLEETLTTIGWPLTQVGLSTIVALAPLLFKQSYLALVFMKTIVVVVILGLFHALIVLPAVLTAVCHDRQLASSNASSDVSERSSQRSAAATRKESFYRTQKLISRLNRELRGQKTQSVATVSTQLPQLAYKHKIGVGYDFY